MAPHSSTLAWKIPWTEEPGGLQSMGSRRVGHNWATSLLLFTFMHWRRKWQHTPVFLPGESQRRRRLVGCHLWGHTELDTTDVTQQQERHQLTTYGFHTDHKWSAGLAQGVNTLFPRLVLQWGAVSAPQARSANAPLFFSWSEWCAWFVLGLCSLFFAIILCSDEHFYSHDGYAKECKE